MKKGTGIHLSVPFSIPAAQFQFCFQLFLYDFSIAAGRMLMSRRIWESNLHSRSYV